MKSFDADKAWGKLAPWFTRALKISGGIGFLLTVIYFVRIGNLPVDNIQSALGLVSVVALLSIGLFLAFVMYWILPAFWFQAKVDDGGWPTKAWFFGPRAQLELALENGAGGGGGEPNIDRPAPALTASGRRLVLWWLAAVSPPWTFFSALVFDNGDPDFAHLRWGTVLIAVVLGCWGAGWYVAWEPPSQLGAPVKKTHRFRRLGIVGVAMVLNVMSLLMFWMLLSKSELAKGPISFKLWGLLLLGLVLIVMMYVVMSVQSLQAKANARAYLAYAVVGAVVLLFVGGELGVLGPIQDQVMAKVSVRLPEVTLVIAKSGCQAMAAAGFAPAAAASGPLSYETGCVLGPVMVKSRLGARWPVACTGERRDLSGVLLTLKGDDVVDFLTPLPPEPAQAASSVSPKTDGAIVAAPAGLASVPRNADANLSAGYCGVFRRAPTLVEGAPQATSSKSSAAVAGAASAPDMTGSPNAAGAAGVANDPEADSVIRSAHAASAAASVDGASTVAFEAPRRTVRSRGRMRAAGPSDRSASAASLARAHSRARQRCDR